MNLRLFSIPGKLPSRSSIGQYQKLQQARQDRAEEETAYDTQLFAQEQEEEPIENLTAPVQDNRPHHPAYDVIADTGRIPVQPAQPVQPLVQQAAPVNQPAQPVQPAIPSQPAASAPVIPNYRDNEILIFDEPTAVLTPQEIDELLLIMKNQIGRAHV